MQNKNEDKILGKDVVTRATRLREQFSERDPNKKRKKRYIDPFDFNKYFTNKYAEKFKNKEKKVNRITEILDETMRVMVEGITESDSGVFIEGIGYFCHFMSPNPIKIVGYKDGGMKVYENEHTEGRAYWLTYFPPKTKTQATRFWNFVYHDEVRKGTSKFMRENERGYALNLKQLHKKLNFNYH